MKHRLPERSAQQFGSELRALVEARMPDSLVRQLHAHYLELARWQSTTSLIGPGTVRDVLSRHYAESLAALQLIREPPGTLVDVGSGAGFPGFVLAAALGSGTRAFLVDSRGRKCDFLRSACRRARLHATILAARVEDPLPADLPTEIHLLCVRAVKLSNRAWEALVPRLHPRGRLLAWVGEAVEQDDDGRSIVPQRLDQVGLEEVARSPLAGSSSRWIVALARASDPRNQGADV